MLQSLYLFVMSSIMLLSCAVECVGFSEIPISLEVYRLRDIGVVDVNDDNNLDIFTTNCSYLQSLAMGDGLGGFVQDALSTYGLDHNSDFPGFANTNKKPTFEAPGLYVYRQDNRIYLKAWALARVGPISGRISSYSPIIIKKNDYFSAKITNGDPGIPTQNFLDFVANRAGLLVINTNSRMKITIELDSNVSLDNVFFGIHKVNPKAHQFTIIQHDRHGIAWADYNGDGNLDAFIVNGGLHGPMYLMPDVYDKDELFCGAGSLFANCTDASGMKKELGRGRQVAWVDYDGDGLLDLYVGNEATPNRLFKQNADGTFGNVAPALGLDLGNSGPFMWVDIDDDSWMDLLVSTKPDFLLFKNDHGQFTRITIGSNPTGTEGWAYGKICSADYDNDGDVDFFVASPKANVLLANDRGTLKIISPTNVGLPMKSFFANFVDYDNNGLMDLYVVPGDIYRQLSDHTFRATGLMESIQPQNIRSARSMWFDANNDGSMDLLLIYNDEKGYAWSSKLILGSPNLNHWLQVKLVGPVKNRQAIGAQVRVTYGHKVRTQQVGFFEDSRGSQGHYRLYFGVGACNHADSLEVRWPDGTSTVLNHVSADQLVTIEHP